MKAWQVRTYDYEVQAVVFAETPGKAKLTAHRSDNFWDEEFTNLRVKRAPAFDDLTLETLTPEEYLKRGWYWTCDCGGHVQPEDYETGLILFREDGYPRCIACSENQRAAAS